MHEISHESPGLRQQLEKLFDLDYVEPARPSGAKSLNSSHIPDFSFEAVEARSKRQTLMAFGLGAGIPILISLWCPLLPQLPALLLNPFSALQNNELALPTAASSIGAASSISDAPMAKLPFSATNSTITGIVDPQTATSSYYWTLVLQNYSASTQEAQMEFQLPKGAAVSRATLWINGQAQEAAFNSTATVVRAYNRVVSRHRDPLVITQKADGHILVKMSPVPANGSPATLRIGITAPLALSDDNQAVFQPPKLLDSNFSLAGKQNLHLQTPSMIQSNDARFGNEPQKDGYVFKGSISAIQMKDLQMQLQRSGPMRFATRATHSLPGSYVLASLEAESNSPRITMRLEKVLSKPKCPIIESNDAAVRLSTLWAAQEIARTADINLDSAVKLGTAYRVVSKVTGAVVLETESDYRQMGLHRDQYQTLAYAQGHYTGSQTRQGGTEQVTGEQANLQAATNTTTDPFDDDATVIQSINSAGTVRVNNLANLEAVLDRVGSLGGPAGEAAVNNLVASSRDANLFGDETEPNTFGLFAGFGAVGCLAVVMIAFVCFGLNFAGPISLFRSAWMRQSKKYPGAAKAAMFALSWLVLAFICPNLSIVLSIVLGIRQHCLKKNFRRLA